MRKALTFIPLFAFILVITVPSAEAATITQVTSNSSPINYNTVPQAGVGEAGYIFFDATTGTPPNGYLNNSDVSSLPSYFQVVASSSSWSAVNNSTLNIAGTDYTTGQMNGSVTITLGAGTPSAFRLGVLVDNGTNITWDVTFTSDNAVTIQNRTYRTGQNNFHFVDITDAASGDTIVINSGTNKGGVVFDVVPEPATMGLLALGGTLLVSRRGRIA